MKRTLINRSWIDERSICQLEAGLMEQSSFMDERILA